MDISLLPATAPDLPHLALINTASYSQELVHPFAFKDPSPSNPYILNFYSARIESRLSNPSTQVFKAVSKLDGEILAFICLTLQDGEVEDKNKPSEAAIRKMGEIMNLEFVGVMMREGERLLNPVKNEKHYYISTFVTSPKHQGKGIGSQLLKHCNDIADQQGLPTYLVSFPGCHELYGRFGFEDVEWSDVDLGEWDGGKRRGYGVYRSYAMVRWPKEINGKVGK